MSKEKNSVKLGLLSAQLRDGHSGSGNLYNCEFDAKDITDKFQEVYEGPTKIINKIAKFHEDEKLIHKDLCKRDDVYHKFTLSFKNEFLIDEVAVHIEKLKTKYDCNFNTTINKYRNILDWKIEDGKFVYSIIDTMGNLKQKQESISTILGYHSTKEYTPQELLDTIDVNVTMSSRVEDKMELFEHLGFNGSCQTKANANGHAQGFHDMFYNGGMIIIKVHIGDMYIGRSLCRTLYKDGEKYLFTDRIYRTGIFSQIDSKLVLGTLYKKIFDLGYNILLGNNPDTITYMVSKLKLAGEKVKGLFIGPARPVKIERPYSYYNSGESQGIKTNDGYVVDGLNANYFNIYSFKHGSN